MKIWTEIWSPDQSMWAVSRGNQSLQTMPRYASENRTSWTKKMCSPTRTEKQVHYNIVKKPSLWEYLYKGITWNNLAKRCPDMFPHACKWPVMLYMLEFTCEIPRFLRVWLSFQWPSSCPRTASISSFEQPLPFFTSSSSVASCNGGQQSVEKKKKK